MVNVSTPSKTRPTTSPYQLKDSVGAPTEFESRCGGKVSQIYHYTLSLETNSSTDMKMRMCLIAGIIILLIVIIVPAGMFISHPTTMSILIFQSCCHQALDSRRKIRTLRVRERRWLTSFYGYIVLRDELGFSGPVCIGTRWPRARRINGLAIWSCP